MHLGFCMYLYEKGGSQPTAGGWSIDSFRFLFDAHA